MFQKMEIGVLFNSLIFCVLTPTVLGRVYTKPFHVSYSGDSLSYTKFYDVLTPRSFGFLKNAELKFNMACPRLDSHGRPDIYILLCGTAEAREFSRMPYNQINEECRQLSGENERRDTYCQRFLVPYNQTNSQRGQYSFTQRMDYPHFFTVILLQCPIQETEANVTAKSDHVCQTNLLAMNPSDEHLSSDEMPLPLIYTIINLVWATLVTLWFFNWVVFFKYSNRLHRLISSAPIFKVILVVLVLLWWQQIASTGIESHDLSTLRYFVQSIENSLLFMTLMVIAEGWGVVRCFFKYYRWTSLFLLFLLFATSMMCVYWVHKYFLAFSICCVVFIMYKTLKWTSSNIELLRRRRRKIRRFVHRHSLHYTGSATIDAQLYHKLNIYHKFRIVCTAFSMTYAIAVTLSIFLHEYAYIRALVFEIPELVAYVAIGFIFRLRNFEAYNKIELVPPKENVAVLELPEVCHSDIDPNVVLGLPVNFKVEKETQTPRRRWRNGLSL